MDSQNEKQKCGRCRTYRLSEDFKKPKSDTPYKTCQKCRDVCKQFRLKNKCDHGKRKDFCKLCEGSAICEHERIRYQCKSCKGGAICEHDRIRSRCKACNGGSICEHDHVRTTCKACKGGSICEHDHVRTTCKSCKGGAICEHDRIRSRCKACNGGSICEHDRRRSKCSICSPDGYLVNIVRSRISSALKTDKSDHSLEYLGCTIKQFRIHIEEQFTDDMYWNNYGEWEIDHIVPIKYKKDGEKPSIDDVIERLHWENIQPMWKVENTSKGNRYVGKYKGFPNRKTNRFQ